MGQAKAEPRARVLLIGAPRDLGPLPDVLSRTGYEIEHAPGSTALDAAARLEPDAIVIAARAEPALAKAVRSLRADARTRRVPVLLHGPKSVLRSPMFRSLDVDEQLPAGASDELERRLAALIRAKRLVDGEERARNRLEALLEISHAAASTLDLTAILRTVVRKLAEVVHSDRCAVLLAEKSGEVFVAATVEAPELDHKLLLDLSRYPELVLALTSREAVIIEDARTDPRMAPVRDLIEPMDVRSILVQPMVSGGELQGALFLRQLGRDSAFDDEDRAFARGVASSIADHLRNAREHAALRRKQDELEAAYVERYRELANANRRLKELNQFKDELLALVSHDIRAPLNVLLGHGQLLHDAEALAAQDKASVEAIVRQGKKILDLVEGLLEKGRGEADRLTLELSEIDLAHQCVEAVRELELLARQRGITLRVEAPSELWALCDRLKIRQVLQNLVQNAIAHARARITVHAERVRRGGSELARLSVVDDGPGIPEQLLPVVFDRYRAGHAQGTGLGLSICREFVELHGGEIWAENAPDGGAIFRLQLSLAFDAQLASLPEKKRVLVVEDEPAVAQQALEILRTRYRVEVARDGAEGIAKARTLSPDLILLDVFLPRVDGLDAAASIRRIPDLAHVPIVLIASREGLASRVRPLHLGLAGEVKKPLEPQALLETVGAALAGARDVEVSRAGLDPATGFLDSKSLARRAEQEEARARRYGRPLAVAVVAIPPPESDDQLEIVARLLRAAARTTDIVGRLDERAFGIILPECEPSVAEALAERMGAVLQAALGKTSAASAQVLPATQGSASCQVIIDRLVRKLIRRR